MKVLYNWLTEFVDTKLAPAELRDRLSLAGIAIEGLAETPAGPMLEAELTINRPDCLGHYGMAREVAALERRSLPPLAPSPEASATPADTKQTAAAAAHSAINVTVECPELCGRYTARVLRGLKVQPSPPWLRQRLEALGHTSINNVVDATNYVMLELGQPLHAFDLDRLAERRIVVRRAHVKEKLRTLDGIERTLTPEMCVIADGARAVAVAGVMGGAESEINSATHNILLESAWFDPISIRRASKSLGLRTEASLRFERGADPEMAETASRRCAGLIAELAGGEILDGVIDVYPGRRAPLHLTLSQKELLRVMGAPVPGAEIEAILSALGFAPRLLGLAPGPSSLESPSAVWECVQPSWRQDVTREVDLIEEVARHFGLDKFPPRLHASKQPSARLPYAEAEDRLRERLIGLGYHEIITIPLVNAEEDALFRRPGAEPARVANPLATDASLLRSTGLVSLANALAWNLNRSRRNVRLFEIGRAYELKDGAPGETRILTIGATGLAREKGVVESPREYQFADLKGDLDQLGALAGGIAWRAAAAGPSAPNVWQHPAQAGDFALASQASRGNSVALGHAAKLAPRVAEQFKLRQDVFLAEMVLDPFYAACSAAKASRRYRPISRFPAAERDFALVLHDGTTFAAVRDVMQALRIAEIASIEAVDLYRGKQMPPGKFSLLVRVTWQSRNATLTESNVNEFSAEILSALEQKLGAVLRTT